MSSFALSSTSFAPNQGAPNPFGEDASHRNRAQEEAWAGTNADARKVFSYRETLLSATVRKQMIKSIRDYYGIYWLVKKFNANDVAPEVARHVAEYCFPGTGKVVPFLLPLLPTEGKETTSESEEKKSPSGSDSSSGGSTGDSAGGGSNFKILVRPRPMLRNEKEAGNYDVISGGFRDNVTLHVGRVGRSGNRLTTEHRLYSIDGVFGASAGNQSVGLAALGASGAGPRTVICYGQTGTGKTYTFSGEAGVCAGGCARSERREWGTVLAS